MRRSPSVSVYGVLAVLLFCACLAGDQWTKRLATTHLRQSPTRSFLGDTFRFQYAENPGAFLGAGAALSDSARFWILVVVNAVFLAFIAGFVVAKKVVGPLRIMAVTLLLSGGVGNLIDRVFHGGLVIDFLNMGIGPLRTGIFNVADMAIMAGFALLILQPASTATPEFAPVASTRPMADHL